MDTARHLSSAPWTRRTLLKTAGAGAAALTLAQVDFVRSAAQEDDELQRILDIVCTTETFGVTVLGYAIEAAEAGEYTPPIPEPVIAILKAAQAQEQAHLDYFSELGGEALTETFTVPPEALTDSAVFFQALVDQEARETSAAIAAIGAFAELGRFDLVKDIYQYGAEEAEHRHLANYALGVRPANDRAFADHLFPTVEDFYAAIEAAGFIDGPGTEITYPGPVEIDDTGVTEEEPGGPDAACAVDATPTAGDDSGATLTGGDDTDAAEDAAEDLEDLEDDATPTS